MMQHQKFSRSSLQHSMFVPDPSRRMHFLHSQNLGSATRQFEGFQNWLTHSGVKVLTPTSLSLACLIAFDGITDNAELQAAYSACPQATRHHTAVRLDWKLGNHLDARYLSVWTVLAIARVKDWEPYSMAREHLLGVLSAHALANGAVWASDQPWEPLLTMARGWLQVHLPPVLYGHTSGAAPMSALPRSVLAREQTRKALSPELLEDIKVDADSLPVYERAFGFALVGNPASIRNGSAFLRQLLAALRPPTKGSVTSKREEILRRLRSLAASLETADEASAILYAFALDLVENGTRRKKGLAPTTPSDYLNAVAEDFHLALDGVRLYGVGDITYTEIFRKLVSSGTTISSTRIAALKALHQFLRAWWKVPPLPMELLQIEVDSNVRANVIWPHEKDQLRVWLARDVEESRLCAQLRAALEIAGDAPVRIGELLVLRIGNVIDEEDHLVVEIAREIRDGREKSREGRRRVVVRDVTAMATVRAWLDRRAAELAAQDDYLFGLPDQPAKLAHAGKIYFWLNRLLKTVTGDESTSLHSFRHTHASQQLAEMLRQDNDYEVNPLDRLANEMGHVGGHVTAVHYCHIYEAGIRQAIDVALQHLRLGYSGTSAWTGLSPEALRQRASRATKRGEATSQALRTSLSEAAIRVAFPAISDGVDVTIPINPLPPRQVPALELNDVVGVLRDITTGLSTQEAALRHSVPEKQVIRMLEIIGWFAERNGKNPLSMVDPLNFGVQALRETSGRLLGVRPVFGRLSQRRWAQLTNAFKKVETLQLQKAIRYWHRAVDGPHLAVRPGPEWDAFVCLLADSSMNRSLVSIHYSSNEKQLEEILAALEEAQATLRYHLGASVAQVSHAHRPGRPPLWLVISSDAAHRNKNGSAHSIAGLHCAFLAALVWLNVARPDGSPDR